MKKAILWCVIPYLILCLGAAQCAVIIVPDDQPTIQAAINAANLDDIVIVQPGTYYENIDFCGKAITVRGAQGPWLTIINGRRNGTSVVTFHSAEGPNSKLESFTITNGLAPVGGGINCDDGSPTIRYCRIVGNRTVDGPEGVWPDPGGKGGNGGGIHASTNSLPAILECIVVDNFTGAGGDGSPDGSGGGNGGRGGGIYCFMASITDCLIFDNVTGDGGGSTCPDAGGDGGHGGGVYCHDATFSGCIITGNDTGDGGGDLIGDCNEGGQGGDGGGIYCQSSSSIEECTISRNTTGGGGYSEWAGGNGGKGGGIFLNSSTTTITDCLISRNTTGAGKYSMDAGGWGGDGGGLCAFGATPIVVSCVFSHNTTGKGGRGDGSYVYGYGGNGGRGGGILCFYGAIEKCTIFGNGTGDGGLCRTYGIGGKGGAGGGVYSGSSTISNCLVFDNTTGDGGAGESGSEADGGDGGNGGGIHSSNGTIVNSTITRNSVGLGGTADPPYQPGSDGAGGGLCTTTGTIVNSILWDNWPTAEQINDDATPSVSYSDIQEGTNKPWFDPATCLDMDPLFVEPDVGDFHLKWNETVSPCKDMGSNDGAALPEDFEGDPRIVDTVDMGADEVCCHLYHTGVPVPGQVIDVRVVGLPAQPVTLYLGHGIRSEPYWTPHGYIHLVWPPLWSGYIGSTSSEGVLIIPMMIPPVWYPGDEKPLQALVGVWSETDTDLTNLMVLELE